MQKDITTIRIGSLWNQGRGATFKDEIEAIPSLGPDAPLTQPLTADLFLIRMKDGLTVILENLHSETELECSRCLDKFKLPLHVTSTERQFFEEIPERDYDPFEVFLINKEKMAVDLTEMLRQEIILHFPIVPVCSERCKGLCSGCRINLNSTRFADSSESLITEAKLSTHLPDCSGNPQELTDGAVQNQRPFANLKDLFKSN